MNKYANFEHLDAFYIRVAQISGFKVEKNESLLINTGLANGVFNYVRFHSLNSAHWQEIINKLKVPFIAFPNREIHENELRELTSHFHLKKLGEVIAHEYQGLENFSFEKTNPHLEIKLVTHEQELDAVDLLSSLSLHHPQGYMKEFIRGISKEKFKTNELFCYVAYLNNIPVGQSFLAIHDNVPGLYFDSVHPDYRKRGIETEMIKARMGHAQELGYNKVVVQCMASSVNIFQRIGFNPVGSLPMYLYDS